MIEQLEKITKNTGVSIGLVALIMAGGIWIATNMATVKNDVEHLKEDVSVIPEMARDLSDLNAKIDFNTLTKN